MIKYVYLLKPPLLDCEPPTGPRGRPRSAPRGPRPTARSGRRPPDHSTGTRARGAEMQAETTSAVSSESDECDLNSVKSTHCDNLKTDGVKVDCTLQIGYMVKSHLVSNELLYSKIRISGKSVTLTIMTILVGQNRGPYNRTAMYFIFLTSSTTSTFSSQPAV